MLVTVAIKSASLGQSRNPKLRECQACQRYCKRYELAVADGEKTVSALGWKPSSQSSP